jgi:hypothetical protein
VRRTCTLSLILFCVALAHAQSPTALQFVNLDFLQGHVLRDFVVSPDECNRHVLALVVGTSDPACIRSRRSMYVPQNDFRSRAGVRLHTA